ncbi:MAG: pentapeptide repeat-containing protein [Rothia sp. (in: high G+C Gram-positive bacteria)]|nr:pentapeptide repeat-containing protein [Rothia sp. (in: high G+C Gram-positive bacteria)]
MAEEPEVAKKIRRTHELGFVLVTGAWGAGAFIYGWLLAGVFYKREYWNLTFEALGWADWGLALICCLGAGAVSVWASSSKKSAESDSKQLFRIVVAVLPALFLVSALAVLVLTLATYNGDWKEARQGIATAFAALIAAVGVVVSVAVSYRTGEENRLSQEKNLQTQLESQQKHLETQLEHQRALEEEKRRREQQKLDAELIKNLNDRLHEIIPRRYGDVPKEVSATYFQLAALYKDWETLSSTSPLIALQKEGQQHNILKIIFGVYQELEDEEVDVRSELDLRTLNSVIQDIFPRYQASDEGNSQNEFEIKEACRSSFNLSYLDLRGLNLSQLDLRNSKLHGAHLEGANLWGVHLEGAELNNAHLNKAYLVDAYLEGASLQNAKLDKATLQNAFLQGANLMDASMIRAKLWGAHLKKANLQKANFERTILREACLEEADLKGAYLIGVTLENAELYGAYMKDTVFFGNKRDSFGAESRQHIVGTLKCVRSLPSRKELLGSKGFDEILVENILRGHQSYWDSYRKFLKNDTHDINSGMGSR